VEGRGRTLLPGLVDAHFHAQNEAALAASMRFGVTTVLDYSNLADTVAALRGRRGGAAGDAQLVASPWTARGRA
jgi:predicted amidohydrolase YtcJ